MKRSLILLSVISSVWCTRTAFRNSFSTLLAPRPQIQEESQKSERSYGPKPCEVGNPPEYAANYMFNNQDECDDAVGQLRRHGTVRITRCHPQYVLSHGIERDVCNDGQWTSSTHECVSVRSVPPKSGRRECNSNDECPDTKRCLGRECLDMCPRICGDNSDCQMINHFPVCTCRPGFTKGNPYVSCRKEGISGHLNEHTGAPECRWFTGFEYSEASSAAPCSAPTDICNNEDQLFGEFATLNRGEFPYLGLIGDAAFNRSCYGVLISERWFLSTADCCDTCNQKIKLGIFNDEFKRSNSLPEYDIIEKHIHPNYADDDLNNVGLYKLKDAVTFSPFIRSACLSREHQKPGTRAVFIGKVSGTLMKTATAILRQDQCKDSTNNYRDESMFCVHKFNTVPGLQMHAGFPLVGPLKKPYCKYGVLGLASFGEKTKSKGYMRLSHFVPWIESVVLPQSRN